MNARDEILARIRQANRGAAVAVPAIPAYRRSAGGMDRLARLDERLRAYGVSVLHADTDGIAEAAARRLRERRIASLVIPRDLPAAWRPREPAPIEDAGQAPHALDRIAGVMTGCALAIAETGTIVLDGGVAQGRRAITLVPDYYLCVVRAEQVVGIVPEAVAQLHDAAHDGRPLTFISGPSATADIELRRVAGVHGPRVLDVILAGDGAGR
jgi:L-lactate dehydrogenase complex protein LldG